MSQLQTFQVQINELIDWLALWKKVSKDWSRKVLTLQSKVKDLESKVPEQLKSKIVKSNQQQQEQVNVLVLEKINEEIDSNDTINKSKDFFGRFQDPFVKEIKNLFGVYIKENIDIAVLARRGGEIEECIQPGIKKQLKKLQSELESHEQQLNRLQDQSLNSLKTIQNLLRNFDKDFNEENLDLFSVENFVSKGVYKINQYVQCFMELMHKSSIKEALQIYLDLSDNQDSLKSLKEFGSQVYQEKEYTKIVEQYLKSKGFYNWDNEQIQINEEEEQKNDILNIVEFRVYKQLQFDLEEILLYYKLIKQEKYPQENQIYNPQLKIQQEHIKQAKIDYQIDCLKSLKDYLKQSALQQLIKGIDIGLKDNLLIKEYQKHFDIYQKQQQQIKFHEEEINELKAQLKQTKKEFQQNGAEQLKIKESLQKKVERLFDQNVKIEII